MISQTAEYALRAVLFLSSRPGQAQTTAQVAEATQTPSNYLSKVLQGLSRAGIVTAQRGLHGGFSLNKQPSELTVLEVVDAVDDTRRLRKCRWALQVDSRTVCPLRRLMDEATTAVERIFHSVTIAELLQEECEESVMQFPCMAEAARSNGSARKRSASGDGT